VGVLVREGRKLAKLVGEKRRRVRDRSRSMGRKSRAISRTIRRRCGEAKEEVLKLTAQTGELLQRSVKEARRLAAVARCRARGRGANAKLKAAAAMEEMADRCEKVARQIRQRVAGEPITDRIVSLHDPDARPIRKGKLGKPTEFGFVSQLAEVTENTKPRARGLILPASSQLGNPAEETLLPGTISELKRLGIRPREIAVDGAFKPGPTNSALADLQPKQVFIAGRQEPASKRTTRRLRRYRTGEEGRISHLKRRYGLDRSRLNGNQGRQIWTQWGILAYNTHTSPSGPGETLPTAPSTRANLHVPTAAHNLPRGRFVPHELFRGK
jgi:IS5 family transposase